MKTTAFKHSKRPNLFFAEHTGEIFALQWKHIAGDHVEVVHRIYRGKLDRPKSERSKRTVALSSTTQNLMTQWRQQNISTHGCSPRQSSPHHLGATMPGGGSWRRG